VKTANILPKDTRLYRARIGSTTERDKYGPQPLFIPEMRMPPPKAVLLGGRANPPGIPVFYCAREEPTAVAEVRPGLTDLVSVAQFRLLRAKKIVDLASGYHPNPFAPNPKRELFVNFLVRHINRAFSTPVSLAESPIAYLESQFIAEHIFSAGFAGFSYSSSFQNGGTNIVLRNESSLYPVDSRLVQPTSIKIAYSAAMHSYTRTIEEELRSFEITDEDVPF
jgi:hypothetical protein